MKKFKVTGQSKFGSGETRTWEYEAENKEELINRLRNSGLSIPSATFEEIEDVKPETQKQTETQEQIKRKSTSKTISSPTRDELLYEMDVNNVDEISFIETSESLGKKITTYKREDLGEFHSEYFLDDGSINKRAIQLHLEQFCVDFLNRDDLEKKLKIEAEKILGEKTHHATRIIDMLADWSV